MPSGFDFRSPHNPYAHTGLPQWCRAKKDPRAAPRYAPPAASGAALTLRARQHLSSRWRRFEKRWLERKNAHILFGDLTDSFTANTVYRLGLTQRDLHRLKDHFDLIDADGSGEVDYGEFLHMVRCRRTPYADALFRSVDVDQSGSVSFAEFVHMLGTFCVHGPAQLLTFCMGMFDFNTEPVLPPGGGGGGRRAGRRRPAAMFIDAEEYKLLLHSVKPRVRKRLPQAWAGVLARFDADGDARLSRAEFGSFCAAFPAVVSPAARLQRALREATLGARRWAAILRDMAKMAELREWMRLPGNGGAEGRLPPVAAPANNLPRRLLAATCAAAGCGREDPNVRYRILIRKQRWRDADVARRDRAVAEDCASVAANRPHASQLTANSGYMARHMNDDCERSAYALLELDEEEERFAEGMATLTTRFMARGHGVSDGLSASHLGEADGAVHVDALTDHGTGHYAYRKGKNDSSYKLMR